MVNKLVDGTIVISSSFSLSVWIYRKDTPIEIGESKGTLIYCLTFLSVLFLMVLLYVTIYFTFYNFKGY